MLPYVVLGSGFVIAIEFSITAPIQESHFIENEMANAHNTYRFYHMPYQQI